MRANGMAVTPEELKVIDEMLRAPNAETAAFPALRQRFPHLSWTRCDASDVAEAPVLTSGCFDLHLIDAQDHCVQVTSDPQRATGLVLARRSAA
jgi:hypothetical protein